MKNASMALAAFLAAVAVIIFTAKITTAASETAYGKTEMNKTMAPDKTMPATPAIELRMAMRQLWEEHLVWTRNYIISALANLEDTSTVAERLLKNQVDIGNAIKPYYGYEAGNKLTALLRDHIMIATEVVGAAKAGNNEELMKAKKKWNANGDDIAAFLSAANPNWSKTDCAEMLAKHLEYTAAECVCRLNKDWTGDINSYDNGHMHMLMFADMLTNGITMQFQDRFKATLAPDNVKPHTVMDTEVGMNSTCPVSGNAVKVAKNTPCCEYKGEVYYFCTNDCLSIFKNNPGKYLQR